MYVVIIGCIFSSLSYNAKHDAIIKVDYNLSAEYERVEKNVYITILQQLRR